MTRTRRRPTPVCVCAPGVPSPLYDCSLRDCRSIDRPIQPSLPCSPPRTCDISPRLIDNHQQSLRIWFSTCRVIASFLVQAEPPTGIAAIDRFFSRFVGCLVSPPNRATFAQRDLGVVYLFACLFLAGLIGRSTYSTSRCHQLIDKLLASRRLQSWITAAPKPTFRNEIAPIGGMWITTHHELRNAKKQARLSTPRA